MLDSAFAAEIVEAARRHRLRSRRISIGPEVVHPFVGTKLAATTPEASLAAFVGYDGLVDNQTIEAVQVRRSSQSIGDLGHRFEGVHDRIRSARQRCQVVDAGIGAYTKDD